MKFSIVYAQHFNNHLPFRYNAGHNILVIYSVSVHVWFATSKAGHVINIVYRLPYELPNGLGKFQVLQRLQVLKVLKRLQVLKTKKDSSF